MGEAVIETLRPIREEAARILADKAMDAIYAKAQVKEVEPKAAEKTEENN